MPTSRPSYADLLRKRAEEYLKHGERSVPGISSPTAFETERLLHELQVHQIELEMQNEMLTEAQTAIEAGQRFTDLYEFSPVAYFSLERDSTITLLNRAAEKLLHAEKAEILEASLKLSGFVESDSLPLFNDFLARVFVDRGIESCEIRLRSAQNAESIDVDLHGVVDEKGMIANLSVTDITGRKRLENDIRRRDVYGRAVLNNIPFLLWLKDEEGRFLAVNTPFSSTFGWDSPESLVGKNDFDIVSARFAESYRADDFSVIKSGVSKRIEEMIETGGAWRWFETYKSPIHIDGHTIGTVGYARDITEEHQADQLLRDSETRYRTLAENSADWIWVIDLSGHCTYSNKRGSELLGYTQVEISQLDPYLLVHPDDQEIYVSTLQRALQEREGWAGIFIRFKAKDGTYRILESRAAPLFDADGTLIAFQGADRDVTEKKKAEDALRLSEEKYRRQSQHLAEVIWATNSGIWELNAQTGEMICNERWAEIIGFKLSELSPVTLQSSQKLIHPDDLPHSTEFLEKSCQGESDGYECELRLKHKRGHWVWVLVRARVVEWTGEGQAIRVCGTNQDINARKAAEEALQIAKAEAEQANRAKSRFLAAASHDLRQPLSALSLYVGILKSRLVEKEEMIANSMASCISSLNELLTDLLDLSKLDAGVVVPEIKDFSVPDLLDGLLAVHAPEAQVKGIVLRQHATECYGHTDPVILKRIVGNLISNAIRYTETGRILVACRRRQGRFWIEVWDTGIGIPNDKLQEVFEEFKQLGNDERNRGSGLGLAIVAKAAALLKLEIRVCSRPGKGSMFAIELPLGEAHAEFLSPLPPASALRIALVDDNATVLSALTATLEMLGHEVVAASSGDELMQRLANEAPDLVISDYRLAGKQTGFDVIATVRKYFDEKLPALLITGDTDPKIMRSMADRGIVVQHKPIEINALQFYIAQARHKWS